MQRDAHARRHGGRLATAMAVPMLVQLTLHGILPNGPAQAWIWAASALAALVSGVLVARLEMARLRAPQSQH